MSILILDPEEGAFSHVRGPQLKKIVNKKFTDIKVLIYATQWVASIGWVGLCQTSNVLWPKLTTQKDYPNQKQINSFVDLCDVCLSLSLFENWFSAWFKKTK